MKRIANVILATVMSIMLVVPQGSGSENQVGNEKALRPELVQFHQKYGTAETVSGRFSVESGSTRMEKAFAFFDSRMADFRIERPAQELELLSEKTDPLGLTHLRFQQVYKGVKVWGCQTIVHFEDEMTIYLVGGQTVPTPELDVRPSITADQAEQEAITALKDQLDHQELETETELIIYPNEGDPKLAYLVTVTHPADGSFRWRVFVDAHTGRILFRYNDIHNDGPNTGTGPDTRDSMRTFDIYETGGIYQMINVTHNGTITTYDNYYNGGPISTDPDGDRVWDDAPSQKAEVAGHYYTDITYDYFLNTHGRDSYDGLGHDVLVNVHDPVYVNNAYWNGYSINFADGDGVNFLPFSGSLDVVGHEFTHAVTEYSAGLIYAFQSGALSESFSDVFGCMIDRDDWTCGEEASLTGGFIRSLQDPTLRGHPKHMDDYRILPFEQDNGGVHINCGIPNHSCYRVSTMIGRDKAEQIWYRALTIYLTPSSGFYFWAGMIMQSAIDLYGPSSTEVSEVELGLIWVGLGTSYAFPQEIHLGAVSGEIASENIWIYNPGTSTGSVDVSAVTPSLPNLTLSPGSGYQETIPDGDSSEFILSYDATDLGDCDLGIYYDTVRFDVDGPYGTTQLKLPLVLSLGITTTSLESEAFASSCIVTNASNTSHLDEFSRDDIDALYGATLMIGAVDGDDISVYRHIYQTQSLAPVDTIWSGTDTVSFTTVSEDGRIRAKVTYTFGSDDPEACGFIIVDYALYNLCDTPLTLLNGLFADFDIVNSGTNLAGFDDGRQMVYMTDSLNTRSAGMALLSGSSRNLRAVHNPTSVWDGAFTDQAAYNLMANGSNADGPTYDDWSALLTFGYDQLSQADTLEYQIALLYSNFGSGDLGQILDNAIDWLGGGYLCGDANADQSVNMLDILHLINYLYKGGPAPDPIEAANVNNDAKIDMLDILYLINYLYKGGAEPECP